MGIWMCLWICRLWGAKPHKMMSPGTGQKVPFLQVELLLKHNQTIMLPPRGAGFSKKRPFCRYLGFVLIYSLFTSLNKAVWGPCVVLCGNDDGCATLTNWALVVCKVWEYDLPNHLVVYETDGDKHPEWAPTLWKVWGKQPTTHHSIKQECLESTYIIWAIRVWYVWGSSLQNQLF